MHSYDLKIEFMVQNSRYTGRIGSMNESIHSVIQATLAKEFAYMRDITILDYRISNASFIREILHQNCYEYMATVSAKCLAQGTFEARNLAGAINKMADAIYAASITGFSGETRIVEYVSFDKATLSGVILDKNEKIATQDISQMFRQRIAYNVTKAKQKTLKRLMHD